ncbi:OstA-like protein [Rickettsia monacensis]|uniref:OstA-like protein n=2 Tax=Rickettsia monacensis TaxID=109232 RepID=A0A0B7J0N3_9RICK|nr:palindromic element RPE1 domain-containing protein [Rickettsia monacensis]CDI29970.1 GTPase Era [Rickettsia monacensis IrR/Munich]CEO17717.1 OstA-like protein [Rickettsia monacensis]
MSLQSSIYRIRHLSKPTYREEFKGDTERSTAAYIEDIREDASTGSTSKLPLEAKFRKMSIIKLVLLLIISTVIYANNKNISNLHITSDTLIIDRTKQKAEYLGNVVVYFDNAILRTKELYIFYKTIAEKQTIDHVVVPTKLTVERKINNELLLADSAKYFFDNKQLILLGNVILQRDDNVLKTNKLIYYVDIIKK